MFWVFLALLVHHHSKSIFFPLKMNLNSVINSNLAKLDEIRRNHEAPHCKLWNEFTTSFAQWKQVEENQPNQLVYVKQCFKLLLSSYCEPNRNVLLEIRAGVGGDEARLWALDLLGVYRKYCDQQNWKIETIVAENVICLCCLKVVLYRNIGR
jgi:protein subunit release factor A